MPKSKITRAELTAYKKEILEKSVLVDEHTAARILAISTRTLRRRVSEGRIPAYTDNESRRHMRFLASELRDYVKEMRLDFEMEDLQTD